MLIKVSTRRVRRVVRLPKGDVQVRLRGPVESAASRHVVVLSAARMKEWTTRSTG
ncbi:MULTISPECIES: hypothetical protein [Bradyrhizobium]|uniref:hypothetical protein n=1 Tax=Bradyrhizobium centrosematis TaxID=1300039 RepID=UPI0021693A87|nr:hypothetical protein [Bradyrhizobium centrosematis]MCS3765957.1 hypothetical protein [Bradyrhizobium centrosematis]MCS3778190.1 hypothetical protein [Bradyrhizobium centrosematis]